MANDYGVFNQGSVVLEYWSGSILMEEMLLHETLQKNDPAIRPESRYIVDCRDADFKISSENIQAFCEYIHSRNKDQQKKVALIINLSTWELAERYVEQLWNEKNEVMAFHSLEAACVWLELDRQSVEKKLITIKTSCLSDQDS